MESFNVHADGHIDRSPFFSKALSGDWKEAEERHIKLPDDDVSTFEMYLYTVHANVLFSNPEFTSPCQSPDSKLLSDLDRRNCLLKIYVFADKILDVCAKDDGLAACMKSVWDLHPVRSFWLELTPQEITTIYERTMPGSPMRRLLVDMFALARCALTDEDRECPQEFLNDMTSELLTTRFIRQSHRLHIGDSPEYYQELDETATTGGFSKNSILSLLSNVFVELDWRKMSPCSCQTRRTESPQGPVSNV